MIFNVHAYVLARVRRLEEAEAALHRARTGHDALKGMASKGYRSRMEAEFEKIRGAIAEARCEKEARRLDEV